MTTMTPTQIDPFTDADAKAIEGALQTVYDIARRTGYDICVKAQDPIDTPLFEMLTVSRHFPNIGFGCESIFGHAMKDGLTGIQLNEAAHEAWALAVRVAAQDAEEAGK
jgi:hypothetical protein